MPRPDYEQPRNTPTPLTAQFTEQAWANLQNALHVCREPEIYYCQLCDAFYCQTMPYEPCPHADWTDGEDGPMEPHVYGNDLLGQYAVEEE